MKQDLTSMEQRMLAMVSASARWDTVFHFMTAFIPCSIIVALGAWYDSNGAMITGYITFAVFEVIRAFRADRSFPYLQSMVAKLLETYNDT
jgi:hypothetical protein